MLSFPVAVVRRCATAACWDVTAHAMRIRRHELPSSPLEPDASTPPSVSIECQLSGCQRGGFGRQPNRGEICRHCARRIRGVFPMTRRPHFARRRATSRPRVARLRRCLSPRRSTPSSVGWRWRIATKCSPASCSDTRRQRQAIESLRRYCGDGATPTACRRRSGRRRAADRRSSTSSSGSPRMPPARPSISATFAVDERHLTPISAAASCRPAGEFPRGETRSYGELAAQCGSPGAARAVGQVMAKNRYPLVVPCHRVLAAGGRIGGFSAPQGLDDETATADAGRRNAHCTLRSRPMHDLRRQMIVLDRRARAGDLHLDPRADGRQPVSAVEAGSRAGHDAAGGQLLGAARRLPPRSVADRRDGGHACCNPASSSPTLRSTRCSKTTSSRRRWSTVRAWRSSRARGGRATSCSRPTSTAERTGSSG